MADCIIVCPLSLESVPGHLAGKLEDAYLIAVDGGLAHFKKMGVDPAVWVGDGDSLKKAIPKKASFKRVRLKSAKNYSDFEFALHVAGLAYFEGLWDGDLVVLGAQGGRLDHELGNLAAVQRWLQDMASSVGADHVPNVYSYGPQGIWAATVSELGFWQPKGVVFSVIALEGRPRITITGARYGVRGKVFSHASMGISNVGMGRGVSVRVESAPRKSKAGKRLKAGRALSAGRSSGSGRALGEGVASPVFVLFPVEEPGKRGS